MVKRKQCMPEWVVSTSQQEAAENVLCYFQSGEEEDAEEKIWCPRVALRVPRTFAALDLEGFLVKGPLQ